MQWGPGGTAQGRGRVQRQQPLPEAGPGGAAHNVRWRCPHRPPPSPLITLACTCVREPTVAALPPLPRNCRYGINFGAPFLSQGAALVIIYSDGSILISHGGVEMGQGLHTKVCQIAAQVLQVPVALVHVDETATDRVPNTSATAASVSTDLYGGAVLKACKELRHRLQPFLVGDPAPAWKVRVCEGAGQSAGLELGLGLGLGLGLALEVCVCMGVDT